MQPILPSGPRECRKTAILVCQIARGTSGQVFIYPRTNVGERSAEAKQIAYIAGT